MIGSLVVKINETYQWLDQYSDPRTKSLPLIENPFTVLWVVSGYFIGIWCLLKFMENQKPFKLNKIMVFYNLSLALLNLKIFITAIKYSYILNYNFVCEPYRVSYHPMELILIDNNWLYYISKIVEFCDTMFFILRKKNTQLSFLHVYHHSSVFVLSWVVMKWTPSGSVISALKLNSFVHIVMYSYYGLAAVGPHMAKYLTWKKHLTKIQIIQFLIAFYIAASNMLNGCQYPIGLKICALFYAVSYLILFGNFYWKSYLKGAKKQILKEA
ncbi:hypothetical protein PVAND_012610 [Polypedilum vanderplanki]|uniref:Elongation of very long chain fatty acids protein n=1 Tax=Polypedilum vanderplanki TaxID=319348 RepID=A0A9J6CN19_POLVA|nr:hypothetical protein PVAND_012610 [Polypedilum vanderplanki]